jgi:hypothetical protein
MTFEPFAEHRLDGVLVLGGRGTRRRPAERRDRATRLPSAVMGCHAAARTS